MSLFEKLVWTFLLIISSLPLVVSSLRYLQFGYQTGDGFGSATILAWFMLGIAVLFKSLWGEDV